MTNMIRRIELLEADVARLKKQPQQTERPTQNKPGLVTTGQAKYIRILGGDPWPEMTKAEAGIEIDRLLELKKSGEENPKKPVEIPEVKEPAEVDTDDAGIDEEDLI